MMDLIVYAGIVLTTIVILLVSIDMSKVAGYAIYVDILITLSLPILMKGTFSGVLTAATAGLMLSITLHTYRYFYGFKMFKYGRWIYYPHKDQIKRINAEVKSDIKEAHPILYCWI